MQLFVNGTAATSGDASLRLVPCGGGIASDMLDCWRWPLDVLLDTSSLVSDCYTVTASISGLGAGSFTLELRRRGMP